DKMLLSQEKAFVGGVPTNPDGTPNYSAIMKTLAEKGDIGAISSLAPIIQQEQNIQGANAPDPFFGGGGGGYGPKLPTGSDPLGVVMGVESGGQNVPQKIADVNTAKGTPAEGYF